MVIIGNYDVNSIIVLEGLEVVCKCFGMYIGDVYDGIGLYYMVFEVVDNFIDEVLVGYVDYVVVMIYVDGLVLVFDNGCGILIGKYE